MSDIYDRERQKRSNNTLSSDQEYAASSTSDSGDDEWYDQGFDLNSDDDHVDYAASGINPELLQSASAQLSDTSRNRVTSDASVSLVSGNLQLQMDPLSSKRNMLANNNRVNPKEGSIIVGGAGRVYDRQKAQLAQAGFIEYGGQARRPGDPWLNQGQGIHFIPNERPKEEYIEEEVEEQAPPSPPAPIDPAKVGPVRFNDAEVDSYLDAVRRDYSTGSSDHASDLSEQDLRFLHNAQMSKAKAAAAAAAAAAKPVHFGAGEGLNRSNVATVNRGTTGTGANQGGRNTRQANAHSHNSDMQMLRHQQLKAQQERLSQQQAQKHQQIEQAAARVAQRTAQTNAQRQAHSGIPSSALQRQQAAAMLATQKAREAAEAEAYAHNRAHAAAAAAAAAARTTATAANPADEWGATGAWDKANVSRHNQQAAQQQNKSTVLSQGLDISEKSVEFGGGIGASHGDALAGTNVEFGGGIGSSHGDTLAGTNVEFSAGGGNHATSLNQNQVDFESRVGAPSGGFSGEKVEFGGGVGTSHGDALSGTNVEFGGGIGSREEMMTDESRDSDRRRRIAAGSGHNQTHFFASPQNIPAGIATVGNPNANQQRVENVFRSTRVDSDAPDDERFVSKTYGSSMGDTALEQAATMDLYAEDGASANAMFAPTSSVRRVVKAGGGDKRQQAIYQSDDMSTASHSSYADNRTKSLEELAKEYPGLSPEHLVKLKRSSNRCHLVSRTPIYNANSSVSMYELKFTAGKVFQVNALKSYHVYHVLFGYFIRRGVSCFVGRRKHVLVMMPLTYDFIDYLERYSVSRIVLWICPEQPVTPSALHILTKLRRHGMSFAIDLMVLLKKEWNKAILSIEYVMIDMSDKVKEQLAVFKRLKLKAPWLKTIGYNDINGYGCDSLANHEIDLLDAPLWEVEPKFNQDKEFFVPYQQELLPYIHELFKSEPDYTIFQRFMRQHESLARDNAVFLYRFRHATSSQVQNIGDLYHYLLDYGANRAFSVLLARALMLRYSRALTISSQYILEEQYAQAVIRGYFCEYMSKFFKDPFVDQFCFQAGLFSLLHVFLLRSEVDVIADDQFNDIFDRLYGDSELMSDIIECVQSIEVTDLGAIFQFIQKYSVPPASVLISYEKALMRTNELLLVLNIVAVPKDAAPKHA